MMGRTAFRTKLILILGRFILLIKMWSLHPVIFVNGESDDAYARIDAFKFALPDKYAIVNKTAANVTEWLGPALVDLSTGFPDFQPPEVYRKALAEATMSNDPLLNQYTRSAGHPRLIKAVAEFYSKIHERELDPSTEVIITIGAHEALVLSVYGFTQPGDEWIIFEPFYPYYLPIIDSSGGKVKVVQLKANRTEGNITAADWVFDPRELAGSFNEKTKGIILNTPHNPTGKVFTQEEIQMIADLVKKWNVLVVADEVYQWLVYGPHKHIRIATLPGMYERTITIGSAGKMFSATGWKVGWAYGPENLIKNMRIVHENLVAECPTPTQEAIGIAFEHETSLLGQPQSYFEILPQELLPKQNDMLSTLYQAGFDPVIPDGAYYIVANWTRFADQVDLSQEDGTYRDIKFNNWLKREVGITFRSVSDFYIPEHKRDGEDYVRICYIKKDETLAKARELLFKWT